jgi:putative transposase
MDRKRYPTDLTDEQWTLLEPLLPSAKPGGRPRSVDLRETTNAMLYLLRTGCPWRSLPHDLPPWGTVWAYFRRWRDDGTLDRLHDQLRDQVRTDAGRDRHPSAAILDSQSVKTAEKGGRVAMTLARRFRDANAILSSIPWD